MAWTTLSRPGAVADAVEGLLRADLVVIDGIGPLPASSDAAEAFSRLVRGAHETCSLAIASSVVPASLGRLMPTLEASDLDQFVRRAHILRTTADASDQAA